MNSLRGRIHQRQVTQQLIQRLQSLRLRSTSASTNNVADASTHQPEIVIPFRIEREATDILKALDKTVKRDHTAPHYKFMDDPYLTPNSNRGSRAFALAKEAGRKAAMWIHAEHAELFNQRLAEPEVKAFLPKARFETKEDASEEQLWNAIKEAAVPDALTIYKLLETQVSIEAKQALLELLCFYNSEEQLADDLCEERWYRKAASRQRQIWKGCPEVEELFEFLKEQDKPIAAAAYNAMICGTAKYMKVDRAWKLFEEAEEKNIPLTLESYNHLIQLVTVLKDGVSERKAMLLELFVKIQQAGLSPNIRTFNSALRVAAAINIPLAAKELARSLFTEFQRVGVEPSLASYYFALIIFCGGNGPQCTLLRDIIPELEGKKLVMQDPHDTYFFVTAIDVARNHLDDYELARRIHNLLLTDNNYDFIGEGFKESVYYRHYMAMSLKNLPFDEFMKLYDMMVPNIYIPEPSIMNEILNTIEMTEPEVAHPVLLRVWSHMVMFEHLERERLVSKALNIFRTIFKAPAGSPANAQNADAGWSFWSYFKEQSEYRKHTMSVNGKVLGDIAVLLLRDDRFDHFLEVLDFTVKNQKSITGTMDLEHLTEIFEACLVRGHAPSCLQILNYSVESGFEESISMARKIEANIPLSAEQQALVQNLSGNEAGGTKSMSKEE